MKRIGPHPDEISIYFLIGENETGRFFWRWRSGTGHTFATGSLSSTNAMVGAFYGLHVEILPSPYFAASLSQPITQVHVLFIFDIMGLPMIRIRKGESFMDLPFLIGGQSNRPTNYG